MFKSLAIIASSTAFAAETETQSHQAERVTNHFNKYEDILNKDSFTPYKSYGRRAIEFLRGENQERVELMKAVEKIQQAEHKYGKGHLGSDETVETVNIEDDEVFALQYRPSSSF